MSEDPQFPRRVRTRRGESVRIVARSRLGWVLLLIDGLACVNGIIAIMISEIAKGSHGGHRQQGQVLLWCWPNATATAFDNQQRASLYIHLPAATNEAPLSALGSNPIFSRFLLGAFPTKENEIDRAAAAIQISVHEPAI